MVDGLLALRDAAAQGHDAPEDRIDALKVMSGLLWPLVGWALPPPTAPQNDSEIDTYRHNLAHALLALGFSALGSGLNDLNFGHAPLLLSPSVARRVRGGGLDSWQYRIVVLEHCHFLRGICGKEHVAFEKVADTVGSSIDTLHDWEKNIPEVLRDATSQRLADARERGAEVRARLPHTSTKMTPEKFADLHVAVIVATLAKAFNATRRNKTGG